MEENHILQTAEEERKSALLPELLGGNPELDDGESQPYGDTRHQRPAGYSLPPPGVVKIAGMRYH